MFDTKLTPPTVDQEQIDFYVARGSRLRSQAFMEMLRAIFKAPEAKPTIVSTKANCAA